MNSFRVYMISAAFLAGCIFLQSCENSTAEVETLNSKNLGVEEVVRVDVNYTLSGKVKARLTAPLMLRVQDTSTYAEFPKSLHVDFYNEQASRESMLDALYGKYFDSQSRIFLRDSVRFIGLANGDTLFCEELFWDRARPVYQFYTDKPVEIRTRTHIIHGVDGFETNQDFTDKLIKRVVNSTIRVPSNQF